MRRARDLPDLRAALAQEYGLVMWFATTQPDLVEGIRAQLVEELRHSEALVRKNSNRQADKFHKKGKLLPRERVALLKWGIEDIRFAPGMFQPQSDSFFSYAFIFSVSKDQALTQEVIQQEILTYYRGLAEAVSKSRGRTVEPGKFTFKLERAQQAVGAPAVDMGVS